jgi:putative Ca2+/H+ antiporter (TMEM165/GDT1 family)
MNPMNFDPGLFASTFALIFVAELPDKTAFATLLMATRGRPLAIFVGVAGAFLVQSILSVSFGSALGLLPAAWVKIAAALSFFAFAWAAWARKDAKDEEIHSEESRRTFARTAVNSFVVIFLAEWGDLTQLATAALSAKYKSPLTIFTSATLALWCVTALVIAVGARVGKLLRPALLNRAAAAAFALAGIALLARG